VAPHPVRLPGAGNVASRLWARVRTIPIALAILVAAGLVLRVAMEATVHPVIMSPDTITYVGMAMFDLFSDPARPAGYSMFLVAMHELSANVDFTVWVQHLIGIATGLILYAMVRRVGGPRWAGAVAAAPVLLGVDQIIHEQALLSEVLFVFLIAAVLYASVRALEEPRRLLDLISTRTGWIIVAGALMGLSVWVRAVGSPLIPFFALWFLFAIPGSWWRRVGHGALAGGVAAAVMLAYFQLNYMSTDFFGLVKGSGWGIYARTAPFADCTEFEPPEGTRRLCESTPPEERPGPDTYAWIKGPARKAFGGPPEANDKVSAFGWAVVRNQPLDYLEVVARETGKYFGFGLTDHDFGGSQMVWLRSDTRSIMPWINDYYHDEQQSIGSAVGTLEDVQDVVRVHPLILFFSLLAGIAGVVLGRGRVRWAVVLFLMIGFLLVLIPPATSVYNFRYALPANGPLVAAGAIGLWLILTRITAWRRGRRAGPSDPAAA
jgi:Dolichyl-phosphate-mannose-protein mannosyltransferase